MGAEGWYLKWKYHSGNSKAHMVVVQLLNCVQLFATPWTAACQGSLSFIISQSLLKLMIIESVISSNHLVLCLPLLLHSIFPASRSFPVSRLFALVLELCISTGASVFQHQSFQWILSWFPLGLTGLISLLSKGISRDFSSTTVRKYQFHGTQSSLLVSTEMSIFIDKNVFQDKFKNLTSDHY